MRILLVLIFMLCTVSFTHAQEYKIAAKVNNKIITLGEVLVRADLMQISSKLNSSDKIRKQFQDQALKDLITEQLQIQEIDRMGFSPNTTRIDEILTQISTKLGNIAPDKKNSFLESLRGQIQGQLAWPNVIRQRFGTSVVVTDAEVEEKLQELQYKKSQKQYLMSEILFPDPSGKNSEILAQGQEILFQLRQGIPFDMVATHVSKGPTAKLGGDLGWVVLGQNDPDLDKTIPKLKVGETSDLIKTPDGYIIYKLRDIKSPDSISLDETYYSFNQVSISDKLSDESLQIHITAIMESKTCEDFERQVKENPDILFRKNDDVKGSLLPSIIQDWLRDLKDGEKTKPIKTPQDGILVFMLCKKSFKKEKLPDRDQIKDQIEQKRFALFSTQFIQSLQQAATITIME